MYMQTLQKQQEIYPDNTYWTLMIEGFKFRAEYDNTTQYRVGDGVTHGGKVYICILDTQGNTSNNTYWSRLLMVYSGKASMIT